MKTGKVEYTAADYFRTIVRNLRELSEDNQCSFFSMLCLFARGYFTRHIQIEEFRTLKLYRCSAVEARHYLTYNQSIKYSDRLNCGATKDDLAVFDEKNRFNALFKAHIHRDWLYIPDAASEDVLAFIRRNPVFLLKPCTSTQGRGILRITADGLDLNAFLSEYGGKPFLMEALIRQHPSLTAINPSSVNTVRLVAAQKNGHVAFIGAGLRCGGAGQFVDNFHHGGVAYPIDLDTGIISGPGIDLAGHSVLRHPSTGQIVPGLQLPHWDKVLTAVTDASALTPRVGYIGWDIAITEDGIDLIEGNINYPGNTIIQIDGPGALARLTALMKR